MLDTVRRASRFGVIGVSSLAFFFFLARTHAARRRDYHCKRGSYEMIRCTIFKKKKKVICSVFFFSFFFFVCFFFVCFTVELRRCICPHVSSCTHTQDHLFLTRVVPWRFQNSDHRLAIKGERGLLFGVDGFASSSLSFSFLFFFSP